MADIDLTKYQEFVLAVTSQESKDLTSFMNRLDLLDGQEDSTHNNTWTYVNVPLLITAGFGLGSEGGEFQEIVKKILFQGKPLTEETKFHMKRELGDVIWYWINACNALDINPNDVIAENVNKLKARYPGGEFDAYYSENRKKDDI